MSLSVAIKKDFGGFSLETELTSDGRVLGILGASGCGKSMTLRCIAGIERPDAGKIVLNSVTLFDRAAHIDLPPQKRRVGYLFQNYGLFPHMTVEENILCGCVRERDRAKRSATVRSVMEQMELSELKDHRPLQLSGGQGQRVALARILVGQPEILMLDEPFSALDDFLKVKLQTQMKQILRDYAKDVILVSHDRDEVYRLCDELAIMDGGKILAKGGVKELFRSPGTERGAVLTGCKNIVPARKTGTYAVTADAWGMQFCTAEPVGDGLTAIGIRAHYFAPKQQKNRGEVVWLDTTEEPFEMILKFRYANAVESAAPVWWRLPKNCLPRPLPSALGIAPDDIMLLYG